MQPVWITEGAARPFYARTRAKMRGKAVSAVAEVCGLGQFNFYINGQKVGDHVPVSYTHLDVYKRQV